jgi:hypothetical protein
MRYYFRRKQHDNPASANFEGAVPWPFLSNDIDPTASSSRLWSPWPRLRHFLRSPIRSGRWDAVPRFNLKRPGAVRTGIVDAAGGRVPRATLRVSMGHRSVTTSVADPNPGAYFAVLDDGDGGGVRLLVAH